MEKIEQVKLVIIGDGAVGKTSLLLTVASGKFPTDYYSFNFVDSLCKNYRIEGKEIALGLWDTAGQDDYDRLRPLSYPQTDIFLICFSVDQPESFEKVRSKWVPEIKQYCPNVPYFLVATRTDLRQDPHSSLVLAENDMIPLSKDQGICMADEIRALRYFECSALKNENVDIIFQEAAKIGLETVHQKANEKEEMCYFLI
ncbi:hypothetical protein M0811_02014 [Anaeramoeba ignava]|uniref:Rho GTPase n=1 Tax=Anaeramoeba ignava TaxID=1746090 RepID=A0A9Q0LDU3_ANAIG|nr:hypothetical protein M0811_02014 [Anaeramoeba ignava]